MKKYTTYTMIGLSVLLFQCETSTQPPEVKVTQSKLRSSTGVKNPTLINHVTMELDDDVVIIIDQWTSFYVLKGEIDNLASNTSSIFDQTPNDIKPVFDNLNIGIPKLFDTNTIWSRFKVLETDVYSYNSLVSSTDAPIDLSNSKKKKILTAYSNLILQINKNQEKSTQIEFN